MLTERHPARTLLEEHIFSRVNEIQDLTHKALTETDLAHELLTDLRLTHFDDIYDTLLYSRLIRKALHLNPQVTKIVDLGAGSSIPSLLAMKNAGRRGIKLLSVDIDVEAKAIGEMNAITLGLHDSFSFHEGRMENVLESLGPLGSDTLIVSNPPYVASPGHLVDHAFIPVNGGEEGDEFLLHILERGYHQGVNFALWWGSLTSPERVLTVMKTDYELIHAEAYKIHFGHYTSKEPLKSYLYDLHEQGKVYFEMNEHGTEVQYVFGTILRHR